MKARIGDIELEGSPQEMKELLKLQSSSKRTYTPQSKGLRARSKKRIRSSYKRWTKLDRARLIKLVKQGKSIAWIKRNHYNSRSFSAIYNQIRYLNLHGLHLKENFKR